MTPATDTRRKNGGNNRPLREPVEPEHDVPPNAVDAEDAVLGAVLTTPALAEVLREHIRPEHFFRDCAQWICRAILAVPVADVALVAAWLNDRGRLPQVGGTAFIAGLFDSQPAGTAESVAALCKVIRDKWLLRTLKAEAIALAAMAQTGSVADPVAALRDAAERFGRLANPQPSAPLFAFANLGDLSTEPEPLAWFLSDRRTRRKLLRMSKAFVVAADGGVGKSFLLLMLSISVVLRRPLFDTFDVETAGHVALFMAEDDVEDCVHRIYRICTALGLSREERSKLSRTLRVCALNSAQINLLSIDPKGNACRTEVFDELIRFLQREATEGNFVWAFIGFDPLARFAGDAETSNAMATAFVEGLEAIIKEVPGNPALGCTHHSSAESIRAGAPNVRGATAIKNSFRAALTLLKVKTENGLFGALLSVGKSNYASEAEPLWLVRMQDEQDHEGRWTRIGGVLRKATDDESDILQEALGNRRGASVKERKEARQNSAKTEFEQTCELVLSMIPRAPESIASDPLIARLKSTGQTWNDKKLKVITAFLSSKDGGASIRDLSSGSQGTARKWARTDQPDSEPPPTSTPEPEQQGSFDDILAEGFS